MKLLALQVGCMMAVNHNDAIEGHLVSQLVAAMCQVAYLTII